MEKIVFSFLLIIFVLSISSLHANSADIKQLKLDPENILTDTQLDMAINSAPVNFTVVNQNNILYIDSAFFATYFKGQTDTINTFIPYGGILKIAPSKEIICLPLFSVLDALKFRYTYNPIYGKTIIRIRTDNSFKVDPKYTYQPSANSQGNVPKPNYNKIQYNNIYPVGPTYTGGRYFGSSYFIQAPLLYPDIDLGPLPNIDLGPLPNIDF